MAYTLRIAKQRKAEETNEKKKIGFIKTALLILLRSVCLIFGSNLFVDAATQVASALGISKAVIGIAIVAGGTSLPELATSIVARVRATVASLLVMPWDRMYLIF